MGATRRSGRRGRCSIRALRPRRLQVPGPLRASVAPNLTSGEDGLAGYTDDELKAMIVEGKRPDGKAMLPPMLSFPGEDDARGPRRDHPLPAQPAAAAGPRLRPRGGPLAERPSKNVVGSASESTPSRQLTLIATIRVPSGIAA